MVGGSIVGRLMGALLIAAFIRSNWVEAGARNAQATPARPGMVARVLVFVYCMADDYVAFMVFYSMVLAVMNHSLGMFVGAIVIWIVWSAGFLLLTGAVRFMAIADKLLDDVRDGGSLFLFHILWNAQATFQLQPLHVLGIITIGG